MHICLVILYLLNSGSYIMFLYVLSFVLRLRFQHKNDVRFVFTSSCLSCLLYVICDYLRILVSNTYCVVFLFCFTSSCVRYCPFVIASSVYSNAYWTNIEQHYTHVLTTSYWQTYYIAYYYNAYYTEQQPPDKTKYIFNFKFNKIWL